MQSHFSSKSTHPPLKPAPGSSTNIVTTNSGSIDHHSPISCDLQLSTSSSLPLRNQPSHDHPSSISGDSTSNLDTIITLRVLLTTKGAGVCIGVKGATIDALRNVSGVRAGVSKLVEGVNDRVLSVSGTIPQVTKATLFVAQTLVSHPVQSSIPTTPDLQQGTTTLRLLVPKAVMGSIIGRGGANIKSLQDNVGVRIVTAKDTLPGSTERVVDVTGVPHAIEAVAQEFTRAIAADWERINATTRLYDPRVRIACGSRVNPSSDSYHNHTSSHLQHQQSIHSHQNYHHNHHSMRNSNNSNHYGSTHHQQQQQQQQHTTPYVNTNCTRSRYVPTSVPVSPSSSTNRMVSSPTVSNGSGNSTAPGSPRGLSKTNGHDNNGITEVHTQRILIPSGLVGGIIGRGGTRIAEIRHNSGATILISKESNSNDEREFTVSGTQRQLGIALTMVYDQLAREKDRRLALEAAQLDDTTTSGTLTATHDGVTGLESN